MSKEIPFKFLTFQLMAIFVLHKVSKIVNLLSPDGFFQPQSTPKFVFGRGSAPDPAGGAHNAPPDPLVGWTGGNPLPIPLDAFGFSIRAKPASAPSP